MECWTERDFDVMMALDCLHQTSLQSIKMLRYFSLDQNFGLSDAAIHKHGWKEKLQSDETLCLCAGGWSCGLLPAETQVCRSQKRNQEVKSADDRAKWPHPFSAFTKKSTWNWQNVFHSLSSSNSVTRWGLQVRCHFDACTCFTSAQFVVYRTMLLCSILD